MTATDVRIECKEDWGCDGKPCQKMTWTTKHLEVALWSDKNRYTIQSRIPESNPHPFQFGENMLDAVCFMINGFAHRYFDKGQRITVAGGLIFGISKDGFVSIQQENGDVCIPLDFMVELKSIMDEINFHLFENMYFAECDGE